MRLLKKDHSGVSEIIGAIMLVLIVVIAASSFAIFLSQYQASEQAQKLDDQKRAQEKIKITSIEPKIDKDDNGKWANFTFTIASLHNEMSEITRIAINDHTAIRFEVWRPLYNESPKWEEFNYTKKLTMHPREEIAVRVNITTADLIPTSSPGTPFNTIFSIKSYVKIDISTGLLNSFSKTFAPPSAVMSAPSPGIWKNGATGNSTYYLTLNGRSSVAYDGAYIISWNWNVTDDFGKSTNLTGPVCNFYIPDNKQNYTVILTVTDNFGMKGRDEFPLYYA